MSALPTSNECPTHEHRAAEGDRFVSCTMKRSFRIIAIFLALLAFLLVGMGVYDSLSFKDCNFLVGYGVCALPCLLSAWFFEVYDRSARRRRVTIDYANEKVIFEYFWVGTGFWPTRAVPRFECPFHEILGLLIRDSFKRGDMFYVYTVVTRRGNVTIGSYMEDFVSLIARLMLISPGPPRKPWIGDTEHMMWVAFALGLVVTAILAVVLIAKGCI